MSRRTASQQAVIDFLGRPRDPWRRAGQAHRHPCRLGIPGRRPRAQGQARGALSVPRLFDAGKAQGRLRGRDRGQPRLTRRRSTAAWWRSRARPTARSPSAATASRWNGRWRCPLRRDADARPSGRAGRIDDALADALGRAVARAHAAAPVVTDAGFVDELGRDHRAERRRARAPLPELFPPAAVARAERGDARRLRPPAPAARSARARRPGAALPRRSASRQYRADRRRAGAVRRHRIRSASIATGDVLYDLAFLLMDLIERGLDAAANIVLNRYLTETQRDEDLDALAALPLFLSVRAAIRAKVTAARRARSAERARSRTKRARLFRARRQTAGAAAAEPAGGRRAVGHRQVAAGARARARHSRRARARWCCAATSSAKRLFGVAETERLPRDAYTPEVTARVYATLADKARRVLAAGHSAIVDAVFADAQRARGHRASSRAAPRSTACSSPPISPCALARVGARAGDASDADAAVARAPGAIRSRRHWTGPRSMPPARRRRRCSRAKAALGLDVTRQAMHPAARCSASLPPWRDGQIHA